MDVTRIKELRDREGMTQKDVAEMIGVSQSTYSTYENGINYLNAERLEKLAKIYGVSVDYLLGRDSEFKGDTNEDK